MTTEIDDGGQAFPGPNDATRTGGPIYPEHGGGMTLRDYFAAKAITDICDAGMSGRITAEIVASVAYEIADAIIIARSQK